MEIIPTKKIVNRDGVKAVKNGQKGNKYSHIPNLKKPEWLKVKAQFNPNFHKIKNQVSEKRLNTVCEEAHCPNISECWSAGTATFMLMGSVCTRACKFCSVDTGNPKGWLDKDEPLNTAKAVQIMRLKYVVLTSVNRDDLPDSGASHYRKCLEAVRERTPEVTLELLCSDLAGDHQALHDLLNGLELEVFAHNVECVPRLDSKVRDHRATFEQSIGILTEAKRLRPEILTKSSIMVGLGETDDEITEALQLLKDAGVDLVTIGQYLAPSPKHLAVDRFPEPERYDEWSKQIEEMGFLGWACGPLVRSSYKAGELLAKASARLRTEKE